MANEKNNLKKNIDFGFLVLVAIIFGTLLFRYSQERIPRKVYKSVVEIIDMEKQEDCRPKIMVHPGKQTADCRVINNFSPTGEKWFNDCGELVWPYSTTQCGEYKYFGWQTWSDSVDEKNIWINGKKYYCSCQWPKDVPDEKLESDDCRYDFMKEVSW